ncbi:MULTISPECIES: hypothetical protein [Citrobacter]
MAGIIHYYSLARRNSQLYRAIYFIRTATKHSGISLIPSSKKMA